MRDVIHVQQLICKRDILAGHACTTIHFYAGCFGWSCTHIDSFVCGMLRLVMHAHHLNCARDIMAAHAHTIRKNYAGHYGWSCTHNNSFVVRDVVATHVRTTINLCAGWYG